MSVTAAIRELLARGFSIEQALDAAEAFERNAIPMKTARQERNARYYQARKERLKASETSESVLNKTLGSPPPEKEIPPPAPPSKEKQTLSTPTQKSARATRLPDDWKPSEADRQFARDRLPSSAACHDELGKFCDFWRAKAGADAAKLDWSATWRNWVRRAAEQLPRGPPAARDGPLSPRMAALKEMHDEYHAHSPTDPDTAGASPAAPALRSDDELERWLRGAR